MKINRYLSIFNVAFRQVAISLSNIVVPLMVIFLSSKEVWGEFVSILLFILLASTFSNFGNKDFLLRKFSKDPKSIKKSFSNSFYHRLPFLLFTIVPAFYIYPFLQATLISLVLLSLFFSQSLEPIIIFEKKFRYSMVLEIVLLLFLLTCLFIKGSSVTALFVLWIYSIANSLRSLFLLSYLKKEISLGISPISLTFYKKIIPFFLLIFLGFLASKIDVYIVNFYLSKSQLADYQIINSICLFAMGSSSFLYLPFTKNIYRNNEKIVLKLKQTLYFWGVIIASLTVLMVYLVSTFYLKSNFPPYFYLILLFYLLPSFFYGVEIVTLFRNHRETAVIKFLAVGVFINAALSSFLLSIGNGIPGALLGSAIAQSILFLLFYFDGVKIKNARSF